MTIAVEDRPGSAAAVLPRGADADVNIDLLYVAADSRLVLGSDDTVALSAVLEQAASLLSTARSSEP